MSTMVMPANYVAIDSEEMTYIEGGYIRVSTMTKIIDGAILLIPVLGTAAKAFRGGAIAASAVAAAAGMSRAALRKEFVKLTLKLAGITGIQQVATYGTAIVNAAMMMTGTSLGNILAEGIDKWDGRDNGKCFG